MNAKYGHYMDDYATYHRNPKNKATHYLGIPMIVFSVIVFLRTWLLGSLGPVSLDGALLVMVPVLAFYLYLNPVTGLGMTIIFAFMYWGAPMVPTVAAVVLFVGGWVLQFIGHHFEGKKPAFFRNAVHLLIGPLWILNDLFVKLKLPAYQPE